MALVVQALNAGLSVRCRTVFTLKVAIEKQTNASVQVVAFRLRFRPALTAGVRASCFDGFLDSGILHRATVCFVPHGQHE